MFPPEISTVGVMVYEPAKLPRPMIWLGAAAPFLLPPPIVGLGEPRPVLNSLSQSIQGLLVTA